VIRPVDLGSLENPASAGFFVPLACLFIPAGLAGRSSIVVAEAFRYAKAVA
jgi:hypothetical protein